MDIKKNTLLIIVIAVLILAVIVILVLYTGNGTMMDGGMNGRMN